MAQQAEQLFCKQRVEGSIPSTGSEGEIVPKDKVKKAFSYLMGLIMKATNNRADPKVARRILLRKLAEDK